MGFIVEDDIFYSTIFLHCVALEFIDKASKIPGLEKAVEFTKKWYGPRSWSVWVPHSITIEDVTI